MPWPLKWSLEPTRTAWEGNAGTPIGFTVKALVDGAYSPNEGDVKPTSIGLEVIDASFRHEFIKLNSDTAIIEYPDSRKLVPYNSIKYEHNNTALSATTVEQMEQTGYDFVFEFIPSDIAMASAYVSLRAIDNLGNSISGTFNIIINTSYDSASSMLDTVVDDGRKYFQELTGGNGSPPTFSQYSKNEPKSVPLNISKNYKDFRSREELFGVSEDTPSVTNLFQKNDLESARKLVDKGRGLPKDNLINGTPIRKDSLSSILTSKFKGK